MWILPMRHSAALEKIKNTSYNLVLLDIKLPGMDGIQALQEIKIIKPAN